MWPIIVGVVCTNVVTGIVWYALGLRRGFSIGYSHGWHDHRQIYIDNDLPLLDLDTDL